MDLFSISELEQFSGIKAHTIRVWEQRYNALNPNRSEGNTRYYNNEQLRRLLNIVSLMDQDYKVSELCRMTDRDLNHLIKNLPENQKTQQDSAEYFISQLIVAAMSFEEPHFEKVFSSSVLKYGLRETYTRVIYPFLSRVGLLWASDGISSAQEHFASNIIKQKLYSAIDSLPPPEHSTDSWLLFLPENEFHELGLLFSNYLIREAGYKVVYLGSNVPLNSLMNAIEAVKPSDVLLFMVHYNTPAQSQDFLDQLQQKYPHITIHLSGNPRLLGQLNLHEKYNWIKSTSHLEELFKEALV